MRTRLSFQGGGLFFYINSPLPFLFPQLFCYIHSMTTHHTPKKSLAFIGLLLLIPPILLQVLWINAYNNESIPSDRKDKFLELFPSFLQNSVLLLLFSLACCVAAIIILSRSFNNRAVSLRVVSMLAVIVAVLIALLNFFQML